MNVTIEFDRGQIADICYALSLAAVDSLQNDCPLSSNMYIDLRNRIEKEAEEKGIHDNSMSF